MRRVVTFFLCAAVLLGGCEKQKEEVRVSTSTASPSYTDSKKESEKGENETDIAEWLSNLSQNGEIAATAYSDNSILCVQRKADGMKICMANIKTGEWMEKKIPSDLKGGMDMEQTDEYIILYAQNSKVVILNKKFDVVDTVSVKGIKTWGLSRNYCVMPREKKIVYFKSVLKNGEWYQKVKECDYQKKNKKEICRIEGVDKSFGKVNQLVSLKVSESEKTLFFSGLYFKTTNRDETSIPCFGTIDYKSGKITTVTEDKLYGPLLKNKMVFVDGLRKDESLCSGNIICLTEDGKQEKYIFRNKRESQEVIVSDKENYYISYETKDDTETTKLTCYSFADSKYQWEKKLPYYVDSLWYFEDVQMLVYSYYDNLKLIFKKESV